MTVCSDQNMTVQDCPYCHSLDAVEVGQNPRAVRCTTCGLYRLFPRMSRDEQIAYAETLYRGIQESGIVHWRNPIEDAAKAAWEIEILREHCPSVFNGGKVLDVGCGEGAFVAALQQAGASVAGLEPQQEAVAIGIECGLDLHAGRFETGEMPAVLQDKTFDLICFRESIYYLPDLRETFDLLQTHLRPGGQVYIKSHVATSIFYHRNRDFSTRYRLYVEGMPTQESLLYILQEEGYQIHKIAYPLFGVLERLGIRMPFLRGRLNKLLFPIACRLGVADAVAVLARASKASPRRAESTQLAHSGA